MFEQIEFPTITEADLDPSPKTLCIEIRVDGKVVESHTFFTSSYRDPVIPYWNFISSVSHLIRKPFREYFK